MSEKEAIVSEPVARPPMSVRMKDKARHFVTKVSTKHGWLGSYDFGWLCMPTLPYGKGGSRKLPPFYGLHEDIPLLLAIICGFQHALAMLAGLITPPIIFASALALDASTSSYLISSSLIGCGKSLDRNKPYPGIDSFLPGILSSLQMSRIPLGGRFYWGIFDLQITMALY